MQKNEASVKYHSVLEEMRRKEVQMQKAEEAEQSLKAEIQLHTVLRLFMMAMQLHLLHIRCLNSVLIPYRMPLWST